MRLETLRKGLSYVRCGSGLLHCAEWQTMKTPPMRRRETFIVGVCVNSSILVQVHDL